MSMKNLSDTIGNQYRDLVVCGAVPQPLPHRMPLILEYINLYRRLNITTLYNVVISKCIKL
jgi:hypothetical protein